MSYLENRILKISKKHNLSHLGSCLTAVNPIEAIYRTKQPDEPFILDNGHAALALYCVLEAWGFGDAEELFEKHGVHPNHDPKNGIWASTGSLGHGVGIAVGYALSNRERNVYLMISDGGAAEGSVWEALRIAGDCKLENLRIVVLCNGYSALGKVDTDLLEERLKLFYPLVAVKANLFNYPDWLQGLQAHYVVMNDEQFEELKLE
jgi:transketolase N-terminal domain/subunit